MTGTEGDDAVVPREERRLVLGLSALQFVHVLEFMIVMPLGPDLGRALGVSSEHLGIFGGAYTLAAFVAGLAGSFVLDRFPRDRALFWSALGLIVATCLCGFATHAAMLLGFRILAGLMGGPVTALAVALVTDVVPLRRRGRAMSTLLGAFSVASVLGVPAALMLGTWGGWRTPFFAIAALGVLVLPLALRAVPKSTPAPPRPAREILSGFGALVRRPEAMAGLAMTLAASAGSFALIPNLSAYMQHNLGLPRTELPAVYLLGGVLTFIAMQVTGRIVDRHGSPLPGWIISLAYIGLLGAAFLQEPRAWPPALVGALFMLGNGARVVTTGTMSTRIPRPEERAGFSSLQASFQNLGSALGAGAGTLFLTSRPDGGLDGIPSLTWLTIVLTLLVPALLSWLDRRLAVRPLSTPSGIAP
ncbi:MAG: MFS transporter [Candidatus Sericytochromatia bacterium]|nr:MFS transporter [Candidatus Sericytochromatia bacterium]